LKLENGNTTQVVFTSTKPLDRAVLISTTGNGFTGNRKWIESPATLERKGQRNEWLVTAQLPPGTTAWFVNARSSGLTVSSDYSNP
jgi:hypothetical protein